MNLKVLKWLLAHKDALLQIVEIAKGYQDTTTYIQKWEIADKIARIVIPILEKEVTNPKALSDEDLFGYEDDSEGREVQPFSAGTEVSALGIDWKLLVETIIPLVVAILRALFKEDD